MGIRSRGASLPAGSIVDYAGGAVPAGWLLCYGQALSRAEYATLFNAIGTTHGAGDGSTTFNLPDCRGRVTVGKDGMGGTKANRVTTAVSGFDGDTLGAVGGGQSHTLASSEGPTHSHNISVSNGGGATTQLTGSAAQAPGVQATTSAGSSSAHRNMQPSLIANKMIKT